MAIKEKYVEEVGTRLEKLNAELEQLAAKADKATGAAKAKYAERLQQLRGQRDAVQQKVQDLQTAGETAWQDLQSGLNQALDEFATALTQAKSRFE